MDKKISPSILSADFGKLNEEIRSVEPFSDMIHIDVMDGHFVPNISFGAPVMKWISTDLPLDVHLMIEHPERFLKDFVDAGAFNITVHQEACVHLNRVIQQIKEFGVKASVAINPATPVSFIKEVLDDVDMVLVMSVNPGFGGQKFISSVVSKIRELRELGFEGDIEVDGGINEDTLKVCEEAGANVFVAGSFIFKAKDRKDAIFRLRG